MLWLGVEKLFCQKSQWGFICISEATTIRMTFQHVQYNCCSLLTILIHFHISHPKCHGVWIQTASHLKRTKFLYEDEFVYYDFNRWLTCLTAAAAANITIFITWTVAWERTSISFKSWNTKHKERKMHDGFISIWCDGFTKEKLKLVMGSDAYLYDATKQNQNNT